MLRAPLAASILLAAGADAMAVGSGRRALVVGAGAALAHTALASAAVAADEAPKFKRLSPIQFIAALGDPGASSGVGADAWGLWREDPGPRGVWLDRYGALEKSNNKAPAGWTFDAAGWWVEEHGLIMEQPEPLPARRYEREGATMKVLEPARRYVVTGDRQVTAVLTVHDDGRWELSKGTLYDVTHLPCRSGLYTPLPGAPAGSCSPAQADRKAFPVKPGALMPPVAGCAKQDWAVLFVVGVEA